MLNICEAYEVGIQMTVSNMTYSYPLFAPLPYPHHSSYLHLLLHYSLPLFMSPVVF